MSAKLASAVAIVTGSSNGIGAEPPRPMPTLTIYASALKIGNRNDKDMADNGKCERSRSNYR
jgi:hypothetical protein